MNYLSAPEYEVFGLDANTSDAWIATASAMIDAHCRRQTLAVAQYTERFRIATARNTIQLSYLPLVNGDDAAVLISAQGRYGVPRRGEGLNAGFATVFPEAELAADIAFAFGLPGRWVELDVAQMDFDMRTGEVTLPTNMLGLGFNELQITYNAGLNSLPDAVKVACAQIVKNAQSQPALNVQAGTIDRMRLEYFGDTLIDGTVRTLLAPYVAQRLS